MLYITETKTPFTCVASQKSFMSLVWYAAKAMNKSTKGSKAYLKKATAFVQTWNRKACTSGIYMCCYPVTIQLPLLQKSMTSHQQYPVDELYTHFDCSSLLPKPFSVFCSKTLTSFGFFAYPTTLFQKQEINVA